MPHLPYQLTITAEDGRVLTARDADGKTHQLLKLDGTDDDQARAIVNALLKKQEA